MFCVFKNINRSWRFDWSSKDKIWIFNPSTSTWMYQVFIWYSPCWIEMLLMNFWACAELDFNQVTGVDEEWDAVSCCRAWSIVTKCTRVRRTRYELSSDSESTCEEVPVNLLEWERLKKRRAAENPPLTFFSTRFSSKADHEWEEQKTQACEWRHEVSSHRDMMKTSVW